MQAFKNAILSNSTLNLLAMTTTNFSGVTTSIAVSQYTGATIPSGSSLILISSYGQSYGLTTSADFVRGQTTLSVSSIDIPYEVPTNSRIIINGLGILQQAERDKYYAHQSIYLTAGTNGNDYLSAFGTSTFSVNSGATLADGNSKPNRWAAQFGIFVSPSATTLTNIVGTASTDGGTGNDAKINVWKLTPNLGATTNLTINLVKEFSITSQNNQNHVFDLSDSTLNTSFALGDVCFVSIRRFNTLSSGVKFYVDLGLQFSE